MDSQQKDLRGMDFSSLFSSMDKEASTEEFIETAVEKLQHILNKRFPNNPIKREIHVHHNRIEFSCPYCGDSLESDRKKRGNIILKLKFANYFKCHNCGEFKRVDEFFKEWNVELDLSVINYITNNVQNFDITYSEDFDAGILIDKDSFSKFAIDREFFKKILDLQETKDSEINQWLKKRLQYSTQHFLYSNYQKSLYILNLTHDGKIIGAQRRNFKRKKDEYRPKYITYNLSKLYNFIFKILKKQNKDASDFDTSLIPKDKLEEVNVYSQLFNIFNVNISKKVTLLEGYMDSLLFKNSIGNAGLHKTFPLPIPLRYCFDDDEAGRKKAVEAIGEGKEVFLWQKFKNDYNLPYRKKWDINDVFVYFHENNIKKPFFENYFSNDPLDVIDI